VRAQLHMSKCVIWHYCSQSGALLACGIVNCGVRNECDPALALLSDYVLHSSNVMRIGAIVG
jgi:26S proteasome regulatory subunit N1